ncbi:hypothetical protein GCM10009616_40030 [Microlunatus lacustris]
MGAALLAVHVLAAIVFIGPVTVAASTFPRYARAASAGGALGASATASATAMYRITRTCAVLAVTVPAFGVGTASVLGVLTQAWVVVSMVLTVAAGVLLALGVVPQQRRTLTLLTQSPPPAGAVAGTSARLMLMTGLFSLIWATVVVLMILRPGSTTGVS